MAPSLLQPIDGWRGGADDGGAWWGVLEKGGGGWGWGERGGEGGMVGHTGSCSRLSSTRLRRRLWL